MGYGVIGGAVSQLQRPRPKGKDCGATGGWGSSALGGGDGDDNKAAGPRDSRFFDGMGDGEEFGAAAAAAEVAAASYARVHPGLGGGLEPAMTLTDLSPLSGGGAPSNLDAMPMVGEIEAEQAAEATAATLAAGIIEAAVAAVSVGPGGGAPPKLDVMPTVGGIEAEQAAEAAAATLAAGIIAAAAAAASVGPGGGAPPEPKRDACGGGNRSGARS